MLGSKVCVLFAGRASIPHAAFKSRILPSMASHHKQLTAAFSTQSQGLRRAMYTKFSWADVRYLSKTHITHNADGSPISDKCYMVLHRNGLPSPIGFASDGGYQREWTEGVADDKSVPFTDAEADECVLVYEYSRTDLGGCWDYNEEFDIALYLFTKSSLVLCEELDRIAEAAYESVSLISLFPVTQGRRKNVDAAICIKETSTDAFTGRVSPDRESPR
jgi:hypothetical protein